MVSCVSDTGRNIAGARVRLSACRRVGVSACNPRGVSISRAVGRIVARRVYQLIMQQSGRAIHPARFFLKRRARGGRAGNSPSGHAQ